VAPLPDVRGWLGRSGSVVTSPARRCRLPGTAVEPRLRAWDLGRWAGRALHELDLASWRSDPSYAEHGGESLIDLATRTGELLEDWHDRTGRLVGVTHAAVIKAAVVHALRAPIDAVWDLDVAPASLTELHATPTGWRVARVNCPA
jgi:broad specificity phosphatase PhoE